MFIITISPYILHVEKTSDMLVMILAMTLYCAVCLMTMICVDSRLRADHTSHSGDEFLYSLSKQLVLIYTHVNKSC